MKTELDTLKNASAAAGVTVIVVAGTASPSIARAIEIGSTVPPAEIAILPLNVTWNLARH